MCCGEREQRIKLPKKMKLDDVHKMNVPEQEEFLLELIRTYSWVVPYRFIKLQNFLRRGDNDDSQEVR